ncbi:unnamed protein product [Tilletia controversa]|nr:unnamed protein product [Tilletia controversa]CAD6968367.1 unnamed protein product [Tilletia controversa]
MDENGILTAWCVEGAVDGEKFDYWVEHFLLPKMNPFPGSRSVLVLDNCNIHKDTRVRQKIEDKGCILQFLPPYSPDLNPIETAFNSIKRYVQSHGLKTRADIIQATYAAVKPEHAKAYFRNSGYV